MAKIISIIVMLVVMFTGGVKYKSNSSNIKDKSENNVITENKTSSAKKGGAFVEYNGDIYYWKISDASRDNKGMYANFYEKTGVQNSLVKRSKDGKEQIILKDNGSGDIFIVNNKIYTTYIEDGAYGDESRKIYSIDLNGKNKKEYQLGTIKFILDQYLICENTDKEEIFRIDAVSENVQTLRKNANIIGMVGNTIYYRDTKNELYKSIAIGSITNKTDNGIIVEYNREKLFKEDYELTAPIEIVDFYENNGSVLTYVGYRAGTANILQSLAMIKINKNGKTAEVNEVGIDELSISEIENKKYEVYFNYETKSIMYVDPSTKNVKSAIKSDEICRKFSLTNDDEHYITIYKANIVNNELYIAMDYSTHNPSEDIGWRYSYNRTKTIYFIYNIATNTITEIYSF